MNSDMYIHQSHTGHGFHSSMCNISLCTVLPATVVFVYAQFLSYIQVKADERYLNAYRSTTP